MKMAAKFVKEKFCLTRRNDAVGQGFNRLGMIQWIDSVNLWQFVKLLHFNCQTVPIYRPFQIVQKRLQNTAEGIQSSHLEALLLIPA
jgi:hypothetical protein